MKKSSGLDIEYKYGESLFTMLRMPVLLLFLHSWGILGLEYKAVATFG